MYGLSHSEVKVVNCLKKAVVMSVRVAALFRSVTSLFSVALLYVKYITCRLTQVCMSCKRKYGFHILGQLFQRNMER